MTDENNSLPNDPISLKRMLVTLRSELAKSKARNFNKNSTRTSTRGSHSKRVRHRNTTEPINHQ